MAENSRPPPQDSRRTCLPRHRFCSVIRPPCVYVLRSQNICAQSECTFWLTGLPNDRDNSEGDKANFGKLRGGKLHDQPIGVEDTPVLCQYHGEEKGSNTGGSAPSRYRPEHLFAVSAFAISVGASGLRHPPPSLRLWELT